MRSRSLVLLAVLSALSACSDDPAEVLDVPLDEPAFHYGNSAGAGYRTAAPAQAELLVEGELIPLATSGEVMPGSGERLVGIPDGIGSFGRGRYMRSYMTHEISSAAGGSRVSDFTIDTKTGMIIDHNYPIDGSEGYNRLCSASWNDAKDGFRGGYFFAGEEASDGVQLALDRYGNVTEMPWIGYYAHEQQIAVPGFRRRTVVVNFDDDGTSGGPKDNSESELYMYVAGNSWDVLNGKGDLYVFSSPEADNVGELEEGQVITGEWIRVPEAVALDRGPDPASGKPPLDTWVDDPEHDAFDFTRLEDGFYDKVSTRRRGKPAMYFFDTGDADLVDEETGRSWDEWGSIYRMEWQNPRRPTGRTTLTLVARSEGPGTGWASPDNGDMNEEGVIMLQEDRANGPWTQDEARIFSFQRSSNGMLVDPAGTLVAQTLGSDCLDDSGGQCWETSGIEDASQWFGSNSWIFDVQSKRALEDCPECVSDGQLLIMRVGDTFGFAEDGKKDRPDRGRKKDR